MGILRETGRDVRRLKKLEKLEKENDRNQWEMPKPERDSTMLLVTL